MSSIEIMLNKETFKPGENVEGNLFLNVDKNLKARDILVEIYGNEHTHITRVEQTVVVTKDGPQTRTRTVTYTEDFTIINEDVSLIGKVGQYALREEGKAITLTTGPYTIPFSFILPEDAVPSYDGEHAEVEYKISANIDMPWKFDLKADRQIYVIPETAEKKEGKTVTMSKKSGGLLSPEIDMIVEINKKEFVRGENIEGKVVVTNKSGKKIRHLLLDLYANEYAEAEGYTEDSIVMRYSKKISVNQPELNYFEQNFKLPIPADIMPTLQRKYFAIDWYLKISLDVAKASDLETETGIIVK